MTRADLFCLFKKIECTLSIGVVVVVIIVVVAAVIVTTVGRRAR